MSELIAIIILIICLTLILALRHFLHERGLVYASVIINILAFILSFKITTIFKLNINLGIVAIISLFTIIYIYLEKSNRKELKEIMIINLITNIIVAIIITVMNYYIPAITETISINMEGTFEYNYKILIAYPLIILLSQYIIIKLYSFVTSIQDNISISILLTYIITGIVYTVVFCLISYINILTIKESVFVGMSTYIIGIILTIITIIFIKIFINSKKVAK